VTPPERFAFAEVGYLDGGFELELVDGVLRSTPRFSGYGDRCPSDLRGPARPSPEAWARFRLGLDRIGAWRWERDYRNVMVVDGGCWSLSVRWGEQSIESSGDNACPAGWLAFRRALRRLQSSAPVTFR
jgi:hypothetical protein